MRRRLVGLSIVSAVAVTGMALFNSSDAHAQDGLRVNIGSFGDTTRPELPTIGGLNDIYPPGTRDINTPDPRPEFPKSPGGLCERYPTQEPCRSFWFI